MLDTIIAVLILVAILWFALRVTVRPQGVHGGARANLWHGSPAKLKVGDVLRPSKTHLHPNGAVYGASKRAFALPYAARWSGREISQGTASKGARHHLVELVPGGFRAFHKSGYLYELLSDDFKKYNPSEWVSTRPARIVRRTPVPNTMEMMQAEPGLALVTFNDLRKRWGEKRAHDWGSPDFVPNPAETRWLAKNETAS